MVAAIRAASLISLAAYVSFSAGRVPLDSLDARGSSRSAGDHPVSVARAKGSTGFHFTNADGDGYSATIHVNGVPYQVLLDTGSSDTWIDPWSSGVSEPPDLVYTGANTTTTYISGPISSGPIVLADVSFGSYTVRNQAITLAYNASLTSPMYNGLIGLGGAAQSDIFQALNNTVFEENGTPILSNLFDHEPDLPNYITLLMSRSDVGLVDGGVLTISEVISNMSEVLNAPLFQSPTTSWSTFMDGLYVNGEFINGFSNVTELYRQHNISVPDGSTVATFDTGTSHVLAPYEYTKAIYSRIPGAQPLPPSLSSIPGELNYFVPCNTKLNITWSFGGHLYPMHPVDALRVLLFADGTFNCIGTIVGGPGTGFEDWVIGDSFLRNTYQLYDNGSRDTVRTRPSIRLLSITDQDKAWAEADALNLARILQYEDYLKTYPRPNATSTTTDTATTIGRPKFTGSAAPVSLTSANNVVPTSADAAPSDTTAAKADTHVAGAFSEDIDSSAEPVDLSTLTSNSYIILGLLVGVLFMLVIVMTFVTKASRANQGYRAVPNSHFAMSGKTDPDAYSTPYDRP
ncbi:acid protease [Cubamyces sp. BRFM 1775]|nr:acid protease [Cubamyces sp. BRFM 1775]